MRRTELKHTAIAFVTLLTLVGTAPAMAGAPAAMKARKPSKMATTPEKTEAATAAKSGGLASMIKMSKMSARTKIALSKARTAKLEGTLDTASAHIASAQTASLMDKLAVRHATNGIAAAKQEIASAKVERPVEAAKPEAPKQAGFLRRNLTTSVEMKTAIDDAKSHTQGGRFEEARAALKKAEPRGLVERWKTWRATRALRTEATKQAHALVKSAMFNEGLAALTVAESMTKDSLVGLFLDRRAQNKVYKAAMSVVNKAAKDTSDPNSLELVQRALDTAHQSDSTKLDSDKVEQIFERANKNHVQAYVNAAERMMKEGNNEYAENLMQQAAEKSKGMDVGFFAQRRMNGLNAKIAAKMSAGQRGVTYRAISPDADLEQAIPAAITLAKNENRPVMTKIDGRTVTLQPTDDAKQVLTALRIKSSEPKAENGGTAPADASLHEGAVQAIGATYWKPRNDTTLASAVRTMRQKANASGRSVATYIGGFLLEVKPNTKDAANKALEAYFDRMSAAEGL